MIDPEIREVDVQLPSTQEVIDRAARAVFGTPLVMNVNRAILVEVIIAAALSPDWAWCSEDYAGWDFESRDAVRLEVKQSASWQSWSKRSSAPSAGLFDIAARKKYWVEGDGWHPSPGRLADIYILAHHPIVGRSADHRDPRQWQFYVLPASAFRPGAKTISLPVVRKLARQSAYDGQPARFEELNACVEAIKAGVLADKRRDAAAGPPA